MANKKELVAIQGEYGSFSHEAALKIAPGSRIQPCQFSAEVFDRVEQGSVGVIPIENSLAGSVAEHFDLLFQRNVQIEAELLLRICHNLIGVAGAGVGQLRRVYSHPVALAQCRGFLGRHPSIEAIPAYDTAGSVKRISEQCDPVEAAIGSQYAARLYGGALLAEGIEDNPANFTRFFRIGMKDSCDPAPLPDKVSVAFIVENSPGTLVSALKVFQRHGANLSKIESRPVHGQPWDYVFYVDFRISRMEDADAIFTGLRRQCIVVKDLGRYAAASVSVSAESALPPIQS